MLLRDPGKRRQDGLQHAPAADRIDEALVLHLAPVGDGGRRRLGRAQPFVGEQPAGKRAVGQQLHAVSEAERAHLLAGAAIEQGEADLVGGDLDAVLHEHAQVIGVEVGDAEVGNDSFALQGRQLQHGVEIGRMLEGPPVELQQVDGLHLHAPERTLDASAHDLGRHRPGCRAPFGERLRPGIRAGGEASGGDAAQVVASDHLGAAVVIGHVEGIEAGGGILGHRLGRGLGIEGAADTLHVGDLPKPGDDAADLEPGRQLDALGERRMSRHAYLGAVAGMGMQN